MQSYTQYGGPADHHPDIPGRAEACVLYISTGISLYHDTGGEGGREGVSEGGREEGREKGRERRRKGAVNTSHPDTIS